MNPSLFKQNVGQLKNAPNCGQNFHHPPFLLPPNIDLTGRLIKNGVKIFFKLKQSLSYLCPHENYTVLKKNANSKIIE